MATDALKNLETLDLSVEDKEDKSQPGFTWQKSKNSEKRFWFLEEVEIATDALSIEESLSGIGKDLNHDFILLGGESKTWKIYSLLTV